MMHLRDLGLLLLSLPGGARRIIHIDDSHYDAHQRRNALGNGLEVSAEAREALIPGRLGMGALRDGFRRGGWRAGRFGPRHAEAALQGAGGPEEDRGGFGAERPRARPSGIVMAAKKKPKKKKAAKAPPAARGFGTAKASTSAPTALPSLGDEQLDAALALRATGSEQVVSVPGALSRAAPRVGGPALDRRVAPRSPLGAPAAPEEDRGVLKKPKKKKAAKASPAARVFGTAKASTSASTALPSLGHEQLDAFLASLAALRGGRRAGRSEPRRAARLSRFGPRHAEVASQGAGGPEEDRGVLDVFFDGFLIWFLLVSCGLFCIGFFMCLGAAAPEGGRRI